MRTLLRARTFVALVTIGLVVALGGGTAYAYWSASGSGSGSATTATLNPPTGVTVPAISGNTVHVTWTASATTGAPTPSGYYVTRSGAPACGTSLAATISATSCDDTAAAGTYTYTVTAVYHSWTAASAASGAVIMRTATKLEFTGQPSNTSAGSAISPAVAVTVEDAAGNAVPVGGRSVTVAIGTNPGGTLSGTTTANTDASGVVTFSNLSVNSVGTGYTLAITSSGLAGATSIAFNVTAAAEAKFVITSAPVSGAASSTATLGPITIQRQDTFGNPVTTGSTAVTLGSNSTGTTVFAATSGGSSTTSVTIPAAASSVNVFYGDTKAGTPTITASGSLTQAIQVETVVAAATAKFAIITPPVSGTASTTATLGPITIQRQDAFENPVTTGSTTINLGSSSAGGKFAATSGGTAIAATSIPANASTATVFYGDTIAGTPTITASFGTLGGATQVENITAGPAAKLCFVLSGSTACLATYPAPGTTFTGQVELVDANGNAVNAGTAITVGISVTNGANDLQSLSTTSVTIAGGTSVSGVVTATLKSGNRSVTLTGHATTTPALSDATIIVSH
jgi:hypothetical protein